MEHLTTRPTLDLASQVLQQEEGQSKGQQQQQQQQQQHGTSYYPPHPGPGFTSLQVLQQEERTIKRTTVARAGMMIIPLGLALLYA